MEETKINIKKTYKMCLYVLSPCIPTPNSTLFYNFRNKYFIFIIM